MTKNLKYTTTSNKFRNFLIATTILVAIFGGFAIFYEQKFLGTLSWSLLWTYIAGAILVYLWAIWLTSLLVRDKKLIRVAIDAGIGAVLVIILKNLITPLIESPSLSHWDFLVAGLLLLVALVCVVWDYLKRLL